MNRFKIILTKNKEYILIDTLYGYTVARHINLQIIEQKKDNAEWLAQAELVTDNYV